MIVSYYGDDPERFRDQGQRRIDGKGAKWPALHRLAQDHKDELEAYDYIWFPDDDLVADASTVNRLFEVCREFSLDLCQPSLTLDSIAGHIITLSNKSFRLRTTNFVEIMAPCFSRDFFKRCAPSFGANVSGWGLDYLWPTWAAADKVAVIDEIAVRHTRARGGLYSVIKAEGKTPEQELAELAAKEHLTLHKAVTGGVDKDGHRLSVSNGDQKKLIQKIIAGYLPELGNYPEHIFTAIEPLLTP